MATRGVYMMRLNLDGESGIRRRCRADAEILAVVGGLLLHLQRDIMLRLPA
jgi:hypothetical protein